MKRLGLRTVQHRGQHFLRHPEMGEKIVAAANIRPDDIVIEIGAGLGNLSVPLAKRARAVHAIEPDRRFTTWHTHLSFFFKNLTFHHVDFMRASISEWIGSETSPLAIGNLPYYLTSPILFELLEGPIRWRRIVVMVQREVAERLVAGPGSKVYGQLSIKAQYYTVPRIIYAVPPGAFTPAPKVQSSVVALDPRPDPFGGDDERRRRVFDLFEQAFQHRRKTLPNALGSSRWWSAVSREDLAGVIERAGLDPAARPETVSFDQFAALERILLDSL